MAPSQLDSAAADKAPTSTTQENKPPIPTGGGAKKAMELFFTGVNHMEFRQRSSSASRSTLKTSSRGATPSREVASGNRNNSVDAEMLSSALKKIPSLEKNPYRPTPPRSRSISRAESPLPASELLDESLPDFYKVTLKKTERTGSQTRDILLDGTRANGDAVPLTGGLNESPKFHRSSSSSQPQNTENEEVPEFRRVVLRRTPSKEQLDDEATLRASSRKTNVVTGSTKANMSRSGSFTSLTSINKTVLSRRSSVSIEDRPEFLDVRLKKAGSRATSPEGDGAFQEDGSNFASMTRSSSYTTLSAINKANWSRRSSISSMSEEAPAFKSVSLKKTDSKQGLKSDSPTKATTEAEFANISLKKSKRVQSDQSKFELESVSLKPIPIGGDEEVESCSTVELSSMERVAKTRVERATKFESGDDEYLDIQSSLAKLKSGKTDEEEEQLMEEKRLEREAWEKTEQEEKERLRKEREEKARKEKEERDRAERETRERREKRLREQKEKQALEQKEKEEMEKKLREEMEKKREEMERKRKEKEEKAKEEKGQQERETKEKEEKEKNERQEREKKVKEEKEKKAREEKEKQEQEENERKVREERVKKETEERAKKEKEERQQKGKEKKVNAAEEQERKEREKQERKERIRLEIEGRVKHKQEEKEKKEKQRKERIENRVESESTEEAEEKPGFYRRRRSSEEKKEATGLRRANLKKRMSFTSSFENINLASQPEHEKVHLSVFTREMGSNHDLVQISQDDGEGQHEVKLEFQLRKDEREAKEKEESEEEEMSESEEVVVIKKVERRESRLTGESKPTGALQDEVVSDNVEGELHKLRKAPSVDGLFQTQEVNAAFTFKLPPPENNPQLKLSFEIPNLA